VSIDYGSEITAKRGSIVRIGGIVDGKVYAVAVYKRDYYIQTFDAVSYDFIESKKVELDRSDKTMIVVEDLQIIKGKPHIFINYLKRVLKQDVFAVFTINNDLTVSKEKELLVIDDITFSKRGRFLFEASQNRSYYVAAYVMPNTEDYEYTHYITAINKNIETLFSDRETFKMENYKEEFYRFDDLLITDNGTVYCYTSNSVTDKDFDTRNTQINLTYYTDDYKRQKKTALINGVKIDNGNLVASGNDVKILGLYSGLKDNGKAKFNIEGYYYTKFKSDDGILRSPSIHQFSDEFIESIIGTKNFEKGKDLEPFYKLSHIMSNDNNETILFIENYFSVVINTTNGMMPREDINYYAGSVIIMILDESGGLRWSNIMPKKQMAVSKNSTYNRPELTQYGKFEIHGGVEYPLGVLSTGVEYLGFLPFQNNGMFTLLFNDHFNNKGITDFEDLRNASNMKKMMPIIFHLDRQSNLTSREDPEEVEKNQIKIRPSVFYKISDNEYLISLSHKKEKRLGIVQLKKS
jgi:hypothetical protein